MKLELQALRLGWALFPYIVSGVVFWKLIEHIQPSTVLEHGFELTVAGTIAIFWFIFAYIGAWRLWHRLHGSEFDEERHLQALARAKGLVLTKRHDDLR